MAWEMLQVDEATVGEENQVMKRKYPRKRRARIW